VVGRIAGDRRGELGASKKFDLALHNRERLRTLTITAIKSRRVSERSEYTHHRDEKDQDRDDHFDKRKPTFAAAAFF
jgi:hypothetical protein